MLHGWALTITPASRLIGRMEQEWIMAAMALLALCAVAGTCMASRHERRLRWLVVAAAIPILWGAAMAIAVPQARADFDTWHQLGVFKRPAALAQGSGNRPLYKQCEYALLSLPHRLRPDWVQNRVALYVALYICFYLVLVANRQVFFGSKSVIYPTLVASAFLFTAGGEHLVDSWNDHLPLLPFYVGGLAVAFGFRGRRSQGLAACTLFAAHTLLHIADAWLWAVGMLAAFAPSRRKPRSLASPAFVVLAAMSAIWIVVLLSFRGSVGDAVNYFAARSRIGQGFLRDLLAGQTRGGIAEMGIGRLVVLAGLVLALLGSRVAHRPRPADWAWLIVFCAAIAFPVAYETENPERYYPATILFLLVAARAIVRLRALARLRKRSDKRTWQIAINACLAVLLVLFSGGGLVRVLEDLPHESPENAEVPAICERLDTRGVLLTMPQRFTADMWHEFYFDGRIERIGYHATAIRVLESITTRPLYLTCGAARDLPTTAKQRITTVGPPPRFFHAGVVEYSDAVPARQPSRDGATTAPPR